jgi:hypothetical protein
MINTNMSSFSKTKKNIKDNSPNQKNIDKIYQEYSLKRNNFNPTNKSPNKFVTKLQIRMKLYYENLR